MSNNLQIIAFPTKDLQKSKKFFNVFLGTEPYVDAEYYVGYKLDDGREVGLDPNGTVIVSYVDVDDIETNLKALQEAGAEVSMEPKDVGGGLTIAQVTIDGNVVGLRQKS